MQGVVISVVAGALLLLVTVSTPVVAHDHQNIDLSWPNHGGGLSNRREASSETKISKDSVSSFALNWTFTTEYEVTATPAIAHGAVYFPSWDGIMYAVKKNTGELIWKQNLSEITAGIPALVNGSFYIEYLKSVVPNLDLLGNPLSRSTPTIAGSLLVFGLYNPCILLAVKRSTGALVWWTQLGTHPFCCITQSGTFFERSIYIGTSSQEEGAPGANCCTFQGAFFKIDATTGNHIWSTRMLPDNHDQSGLYSGAAVWGSSPSIDVARRLVYIATGNTYTVPPEIQACEEARLNETNPPIPDPCLEDGNLQESMVAIDIDSGNITWARHLGGYDTWTLVCQLSPVPLPNCPTILGPDFDFGEAPFLLSIQEPGGGPGLRDVVVAGQKSGIVHTVDRSTGEVVWQTDAGPGGVGGGSIWGMTTDGERVFTNIANTGNKNFTLVPSSEVITWGGWVGINASTGAVIWSTASPDNTSTTPPLSYAHGVVFGGSQGSVATGSPSGKIVALDAQTGEILWTYATEGGLNGGPSISDGCLFQPVGGSLSFTLALPNNTIHGKSTISLCIP